MKRLFLLAILSIGVVQLSNILLNYPYITWLEDYSMDSEQFRAQNFGEQNLNKIEDFASTYQLDFYKALTVFMTSSNCNLSSSFIPSYTNYLYAYNLLEQKRKIQYQKLENAYRIILDDLQCFPIPADYSSQKLEVVYENSFGEERTYGGIRKHEGCDLMAVNNCSGYYPIVSMTDGVVENIGWLEQGGWRIGIRAPSGGYFYYAHLSDYFKDFTKDQEVKAGEILGFMGDTGYSKVEGTTGNFDVHLHLGIYIQTDLSDEVSVNPYYILKYLENKLLYYHYK